MQLLIPPAARRPSPPRPSYPTHAVGVPGVGSPFPGRAGSFTAVVATRTHVLRRQRGPGRPSLQEPARRSSHAAEARGPPVSFQGPPFCLGRSSQGQAKTLSPSLSFAHDGSQIRRLRRRWGPLAPLLLRFLMGGSRRRESRRRRCRQRTILVLSRRPESKETSTPGASIVRVGARSLARPRPRAEPPRVRADP